MKQRKPIAVLALMLASISAQASDTCIKPHELEADKIRFVEVQLKVAALQCRRGVNQQISLRYNQFVKEKMPYLIASQSPMKRWLARTKRGNLDQYIVRVANIISLSSAKSGQFCDRSRVAAEYAAKTYTPLMLLPLLPVAYENVDKLCKETQDLAMG